MSRVLYELLAAAACLSWIANLLLAILSFLGLHYLATHFASLFPDIGTDYSAQMGQQIAYGLVQAAQYLVPCLFLLAALISFSRQFRFALGGWLARLEARRRQTSPVVNDDKLVVSRVHSAFETAGFTVAARSFRKARHVFEIEVWRDKEKFLALSKYWRAECIGLDIVTDFYNAIVQEGATGGFIIAAGGLSPEAEVFASKHAIALITTASVLEN